MRYIALWITLCFWNTALMSQTLTGSLKCASSKRNSLKDSFTNHERLQKANSDTTIDITYYGLNLHISYHFDSEPPHYTSKWVKGIALVKAKSQVDSLKTVILDLKNVGIHADSIAVDDVLQPFTHIADLLQINLGKTLLKGEPFAIKIYYQGIPDSSGYGSFVFTTHDTATAKPHIYTLSEPFGAADWFPCKNSPDDKADSSDVWITAPATLVAVSNGILSSVEVQDSTHTYHWKSRYPIASYLISIALADYELYDTTFTHGDTLHMPVTHYVFPEANTPENKINMDETLYLLGLYSEKLGPYPFLKEKYGHAQFTWGGGMEHQTCSSVSDFGNGVVAHELAHQWFGDKITCIDWENIWLNEGFASYCETIYTENRQGSAQYNSNLNAVMEGAKRAKGSIYVEHPTDINEIFNSDRTYLKGATVLHMLRRIVGDEAFFKILQQYLTSVHAYGNACTEDFEAVATAVYQKDLDYFFKEWIYGYNYPVYQFGWASASTPKPTGYPLYIRIDQNANAATPIFFSMPIQLQITYADQSTEQITVFQHTASFDTLLFTPKVPNTLSFDADNSILKDVSTIAVILSDSLLDAIDDETALDASLQIAIQPNPADQEFTIKLFLKKVQTLQIQLISIDGKINTGFLPPQEFGAGPLQIQHYCQHLPAGMYFLQIQSEHTVNTAKIVISH